MGCALNPLEEDQLLNSLGFRILCADLVDTAKMAGYGMLKLLLGPSYPDTVGRKGSLPARGVHAAQYAISALWIVFSIVGVIVFWRGSVHRDFLVVSLVTTGYLILLSLGLSAYSRFRAPFLPYLAVYCATGVFALIERVAHRRT